MAITRRSVLAGAAAGVTLSALAPYSAARAQATGPVLPAIRERTTSFLDRLAPEKAARARFEFGDATWRGWDYFGNNLFKPGIRFEEMDEAESEAGTELLTALLSPAGFVKAERVRILQDVLAQMGVGAPDRNSGRYSFAVFGTPGPNAVWGLRFEGHHLTLSCTLQGDEVVSVTPSSFSCNPNDVSVGVTAGTTALVEEEDLARRLFADLTPALQDEARVADSAYRNIFTFAGREDRFRSPDGVAAAEMVPAQQELLWRLVDAYAVDHWPEPLAAAQRARVREGDQAAVHFAWAGGNTEGTPLYYRLSGDNFVMELAAVDPAAQHLHTIYHDSERTLGQHVGG
ncbi:MAG: DUF3500 domain-containing protein [Bauldia sp.]|nr:DUF3500 domain-containing protein [Bauldia sp.]